MVAPSPLFQQGRWSWNTFNSTIIDDIWADVAFFTLVAIMVTTISELTEHKLAISNQMLTVLGTVLGLVISFRTTSAYTSYQDGRRMWTNIMVGTRNLAQLIWIHVPNEPKEPEKKANDDSDDAKRLKEKNKKTLQTMIEKKSMINLIQAFAISVKHFLRGEPGVFYKDLYPLISFLPRYTNISHHDADLLPLWAASHDRQGSLPPNPSSIDESMPANRNPREVADDPNHPLHRTTSEPTHADVQPIEEPIPSSSSTRPRRGSDTPTLVGTSRGARRTIRHNAYPSDMTLFESEQLLPNPHPDFPENLKEKQPTSITTSPPADSEEPWIPAGPDSPTPTLVGSPKRKVSDLEMGLPKIPCHRDLNPARLPPKVTIYDYIPLFKLFRWAVHAIRKKHITPNAAAHRAKRKKLDVVDSNVPLEIYLYLSNYSSHVMRSGLVQPAVATGIYNNLTLLQDTLSNLERIRNTPLPFAYQVHLRMSVWLYLCFLPFQMYTNFGWWTIPTTTFASFLYLGFLEIGQEIENPFAYDLNDLNVDGFCSVIQKELHEITAFTCPEPSSFILTEWNHPFAPVDGRNALDLMDSIDNEGLFMMKHGARRNNAHDAPAYGIPSVQRVLVSNWKKVDRMTKQE